MADLSERRSALDDLTQRTGLSAEQRMMRARKAALTRWSKETPTREHALRAQSGLLAKFLADVPTDLPDAERHRRAIAARRAHMVGLALASSRARSARAGARAA